MILNYTEAGWIIVTQRAHGLLAAQICGHWRKDMQPERWVETLIATAEHDDVSNELQEPELLENGGPKDFKMIPFEKDYCEQLLEKALAKGRYIGILTSMHLRFLYSGEKGARAYCQELAKKEKMWTKEAKTTIAQTQASYNLLEFCDAFSLLICQHLAQPDKRSMEISSGPDGTIYHLTLSGSGCLVVDPWPFEESTFEVNYESRAIPRLTFKDTAEFRQELQAAKVTLHVVTIAKDLD